MLAELWRQGRNLPGIIGRTRYAKSLGLLTRDPNPETKPKFSTLIPRNAEFPFKWSGKFPVHGVSIRRLEVIFAEQEDHHDGESYSELATLPLENLPPGPGSNQQEYAEVTIECLLGKSPTFTVKFRDVKVVRDLNEFVERMRSAKFSGISRNGHATMP